MTGATWVFDVDGCLVDSHTGTSLRPGAMEVLVHLRAQGCTLLLWSAGGADYARQRAVEQRMSDLFHGFHDKEGRDASGRFVTDGLGADLASVVFVDDRPEDMPLGADVVAVAPYLVDNPHDRGLAVVANRAGLADVERT